MPTSLPSLRRTQAERSAATKQRLVDAAVTCLIENGYAHTTMVEVCDRAGLTRGALHHHFSSLVDLLTEVLEQLYTRLATPLPQGQAGALETLIHEGWARVSRPEFKAVIEIWLAARNDPSLGKDLGPAIARLSELFSIEQNPRLAGRIGSSAERRAFYRVAFEAMIGLALGRATSPDGAAVAHENDVIEMLASLARRHEQA